MPGRPPNSQAPSVDAAGEDVLDFASCVPCLGSTPAKAGGRQDALDFERPQMRCTPVAVTVPKTEEVGGYLQKQVVYIVEAAAFGAQYTTRHPFEDFEALHSALAAKATSDLPALPPKFWFGNDAPDVVQERQQRLEDVLVQLAKLAAAMSDDEESFLNFLQLPKAVCIAVRFLISPPGGRRQWLQQLHEATAESGSCFVLQDRNVEEALLGAARGALAAEEETGAAAEKRWGDVCLVCELLARAFGQAPQEPQPKGEVVKFLLECMTSEQLASESEAPLDFRMFQAAVKALHALAVAGRSPWCTSLQEFLIDDGLHCFATAVGAWLKSGDKQRKVVDEAVATSASSDARPETHGPRLVAELLLRGFDSEVVQQFAKHNLVAERKQLLNHFFTSQDPFVRVAAGLLLSRLLCEIGYSEALKAESGVQGLYEELLYPKGAGLADADLEAFLAEEEMVQWLCDILAAPQPTASAFVLLVIAEFVPSLPPRVLEIPGLHETLLAKLDPHQDLAVRGPAARILLEAYRGNGGPPGGGPLPIDLSNSLASSVEAGLLRSGSEHATLGQEVAQVQDLYGLASGVDLSMQQASACAALLGNQVRVWSEVLEQFAAACRVAQEAHAREGRIMSTQRCCILECREQVMDEQARQDGHDGTASSVLERRREELADQEAEYSASEARLKALAEAQMAVSSTLAQHQEAVKQADPLAQFPKTMKDLACGIGGHSQQDEAVPQAVAAAIAQAADLGEQMRQASEQLPAQKEVLVESRTELEGMAARRGNVLESFCNLRTVQTSCVDAVQSTGRQLHEVHSRFQEERSRRRGVREAVRQLAVALQALDGQLEELDLLEARSEELLLAS